MPRRSLTARAEDDLIDLWQYIGVDNPEAADTLLNQIDNPSAALAELPELGPARPDLARRCATTSFADISSCIE